MQLHRLKKATNLPLGGAGSGKGPVLRQQWPVAWKGVKSLRPAWWHLWVLPSLETAHTHTFLVCW